MVGKFMNLGMAVMTAGNAIGCTAVFNLLILQSTIFQSLIFKTRLEKSAATATTVVIGFIRIHLHQVFFTDCLLDGISEIFGNGIAKTFSYDLAGILNSKLDLQVLVPIRIWFQFSFSDPFGVIFVDIFCFKAVSDIKFFQSGPDCEGDVASLGIEVCLNPQGIGGRRLPADQ
jgi:hypothetical protein